MRFLLVVLLSTFLMSLSSHSEFMDPVPIMVQESKPLTFYQKSGRVHTYYQFFNNSEDKSRSRKVGEYGWLVYYGSDGIDITYKMGRDAQTFVSSEQTRDTTIFGSTLSGALTVYDSSRGTLSTAFLAYTESKSNIFPDRPQVPQKSWFRGPTNVDIQTVAITRESLQEVGYSVDSNSLDTKAHVALRVDGDWYVSERYIQNDTGLYYEGDVGIMKVAIKGSFWYPIDFSHNEFLSTFVQGVPIELPKGEVDAIGVFCELIKVSDRPLRVTIDDFYIKVID